MKLQGKVAFITGGGGGIGGGMAQAFAEKGMKLILADIDLASKSGGDGRALLELWMLRTCGRGDRSHVVPARP